MLSILFLLILLNDWSIFAYPLFIYMQVGYKHCIFLLHCLLFLSLTEAVQESIVPDSQVDSSDKTLQLFLHNCMSPYLCWKHAILVTAAFFYLSSPEARRFSLWIITLSFVSYLVSRTCILNFGIFLAININ